MCAATALWEAAVFLATVGPLVRAWEEADDIGRCSSKTLQGIRDVLVVVVVDVVVVGVVIMTGPCLIAGDESSSQIDMDFLTPRGFLSTWFYDVIKRKPYLLGASGVCPS